MCCHPFLLLLQNIWFCIFSIEYFGNLVLTCIRSAFWPTPPSGIRSAFLIYLNSSIILTLLLPTIAGQCSLYLEIAETFTVRRKKICQSAKSMHDVIFQFFSLPCCWNYWCFSLKKKCRKDTFSIISLIVPTSTIFLMPLLYWFPFSIFWCGSFSLIQNQLGGWIMLLRRYGQYAWNKLHPSNSSCLSYPGF